MKGREYIALALSLIYCTGSTPVHHEMTAKPQVEHLLIYRAGKMALI